jgi:hypothetical protein
MHRRTDTGHAVVDVEPFHGGADAFVGMVMRRLNCCLPSATGGHDSGAPAHSGSRFSKGPSRTGYSGGLACPGSGSSTGCRRHQGERCAVAHAGLCARHRRTCRRRSDAQHRMAMFGEPGGTSQIRGPRRVDGRVTCATRIAIMNLDRFLPIAPLMAWRAWLPCRCPARAPQMISAATRCPAYARFRVPRCSPRPRSAMPQASG